MPREYIAPEPLKDDDEMPFGKYKGTLMINVPAKYLLYIYDSHSCTQRVKEYIERNMDVLKKQAADGN